MSTTDASKLYIMARRASAARPILFSDGALVCVLRGLSLLAHRLYSCGKAKPSPTARGWRMKTINGTTETFLPKPLHNIALSVMSIVLFESQTNEQSRNFGLPHLLLYQYHSSLLQTRTNQTALLTSVGKDDSSFSASRSSFLLMLALTLGQPQQLAT